MAEENQAVPSTYAGLMIRLGQAADQLRVHGEALKKMGAAAPECLVEPYNRYRQKVLKAAESLFEAFRREHGQEACEILSSRAAGFLRTIDDMPENLTAGPSLGPNWTEEAFGGAGPGIVGGESLGAPRGPGFFWRGVNSVPRGVLPPVLQATEAVAGRTFWRGLVSSGRSILGFAAKHVVWVWAIVSIRGDDPWDEIREFVHSRGQGAAVPMLRDVVERTLRSFEDDYLARTVQQWQAVIKIARQTGGNVDLMRGMMEEYDPHLEKPLPLPPDAWDAFMIADLAGIEVPRENTHSWIAIPVLVGGSMLTIYVGGEG